LRRWGCTVLDPVLVEDRLRLAPVEAILVAVDMASRESGVASRK
jgi:hypothetical protein